MEPQQYCLDGGLAKITANSRYGETIEFEMKAPVTVSYIRKWVIEFSITNVEDPLQPKEIILPISYDRDYSNDILEPQITFEFIEDEYNYESYIGYRWRSSDFVMASIVCDMNLWTANTQIVPAALITFVSSDTTKHVTTWLDYDFGVDFTKRKRIDETLSPYDSYQISCVLGCEDGYTKIDSPASPGGYWCFPSRETLKNLKALEAFLDGE